MNFDVDDYLQSLYALLHRLTINHYQDSLLHDRSKLLEDIPLAVRERMCYMRSLAALCEMFSATHITTKQRTHYMASMLVRFQSSKLLPVGNI
jgi:hypothetical protein